MEVNFALEQIHDVAARVLTAATGHSVLAFHGEMGAGKTTLIHALCEQLGVKDTVSSPTFSIINQYQKGDGGTLYHMDLYRIRDEQEAINAGVEDCLYSGHSCLVEWPEKVPGIFPTDTLHIYLQSMPGNARNLRINL